MQLVYTYFCNLSRKFLQNTDKNAGFLREVAKMREWERGITRGETQFDVTGGYGIRPYKIT